MERVKEIPETLVGRGPVAFPPSGVIKLATAIPLSEQHDIPRQKSRRNNVAYKIIGLASMTCLDPGVTNR